jgi:hypothetical protein
MTDLSTDDIKSLGRAVGLNIEEPHLTEVAYNLNALQRPAGGLAPPGLEHIEPLPIIPPYERI